MNSRSLFIISVLLTGSLCLDVQPRKDNKVTKLLKELLDGVYNELSRNNISVPMIDLGKGVGNLSNLEVSVPGGMTKEIDGRGSFGFTFATELKQILLKSQYDLQHLDIPKLFPIFGKGVLEASIERLSLDLEFNARFDALKEEFDITIPKFNLSAGTSKVKFESLMDNPALTKLLNELISDLVPHWVTMLKEPLVHSLIFYGKGILRCIREKPLALKQCIIDLFRVYENELSSEIADIITTVARNHFPEFNFVQ